MPWCACSAPWKPCRGLFKNRHRKSSKKHQETITMHSKSQLFADFSSWLLFADWRCQPHTNFILTRKGPKVPASKLAIRLRISCKTWNGNRMTKWQRSSFLFNFHKSFSLRCLTQDVKGQPFQHFPWPHWLWPQIYQVGYLDSAHIFNPWLCAASCSGFPLWENLQRNLKRQLVIKKSWLIDRKQNDSLGSPDHLLLLQPQGSTLLVLPQSGGLMPCRKVRTSPRSTLMPTCQVFGLDSKVLYVVAKLSPQLMLKFIRRHGTSVCLMLWSCWSIAWSCAQKIRTGCAVGNANRLEAISSKRLCIKQSKMGSNMLMRPNKICPPLERGQSCPFQVLLASANTNLQNMSLLKPSGSILPVGLWMNMIPFNYHVW